MPEKLTPNISSLALPHACLTLCILMESRVKELVSSYAIRKMSYALGNIYLVMHILAANAQTRLRPDSLSRTTFPACTRM